jgi:non-heme chloroperoxidase
MPAFTTPDSTQLHYLDWGPGPSWPSRTGADLLRDRPAWIRAAAPGFIGHHAGVQVSDEVYEWGIGITEAASPLATVEMLRSFPFTDSRAELAALTLPALVIHGDSDVGNPLELCGHRTADLLPNAEL